MQSVLHSLLCCEEEALASWAQGKWWEARRWDPASLPAPWHFPVDLVRGHPSKAQARACVSHPLFSLPSVSASKGKSDLISPPHEPTESCVAIFLGLVAVSISGQCWLCIENFPRWYSLLCSSMVDVILLWSFSYTCNKYPLNSL